MSSRRTATLASLGLAALAVLAGPARAQRFPPRMPRPQFPFGVSPVARPTALPWYATQYNPGNIVAADIARNIATIGQGIASAPPWVYGYNPYVSPIAPLASGYGLSTVGGVNPYATGSLSSYGGGGYGGYGGYSGGYAMSTAPYTSSGYGISPGSGDSVGAYLQSVAAVTAATGQYYRDIQQARMTREQTRQMALDTLKKQWELEQYWNSIRPTAPKMIDQENATRLEDARNRATPARIWSGDALNELLRSVIRAGKLSRGPTIRLDEDTLRRLNLTDKASRGNVGLIKSGAKLNWPLVLQGPGYDELRKPLERKLREAVDQLKDKEPVSATTLRDIGRLNKELNDRLNEGADELAPSQYIEARRYLNQVNQAVKALEGKNAVNHFNNTWNAKGKNVAELVDHMRREGLEFAPATDGDEAAYNALYNALRSFEASTQTASR